MKASTTAGFRLVLAAILTISALAPSAAHAYDLTATDIFIPVVARTAGANGSQWRTDLTVTNVSRAPQAVTVFIKFIPTGTNQEHWSSEVLDPRQTLVLDDFIRNRFGLQNAVGTVRITSPSKGARLTANARIYNRGSVYGEFGQGVPALPVDGLTGEHYLTGLTALGGNRTNIGISNPWELEVQIWISLYDEYGDLRGAFATALGPRDLLQLNDVFAHFSTGPLEGATVHITSDSAVATYASIVRNDSGDARFITGSGFARGNEILLPTACSWAGPVNLVRPGTQAADGWIVRLRDNYVDPVGRAALLAQEYNFTVIQMLESLRSFHAELTPEQIALLRCNSAVALISQNTQITP
jgi:hypothetical protein